MTKQKQLTAKQIFIGEYLDKVMKDHGLPYGIKYLNMLSNEEDKAIKAWNKLRKANPVAHINATPEFFKDKKAMKLMKQMIRKAFKTK